jgi:methyl-accepting chemotaxis protein
VVAQEVRKLAERSQVAAREIGTITGGSVGQAETAGKILGDIEPAVRKTAELIEAINESAKTQDEGITQIKDAIGQINRATQQNSAASEQLAATSEQLQGLMKNFRVSA